VTSLRVTLCALSLAVAAGFGFADRLRAAADALQTESRLPPGALRGLAHRLHQYPTLSLATPAQRRAAEQLLAESRAAVRPWRRPRAGDAAGFDNDGRRSRSSGPIRYFHAEHRPYSSDRVYLDPDRPESLIYADAPGRPLVLVGVMFALPRGVKGPSPGGPITRWHWHRVCARGKQRGLAPRADGTCPPGTKLRNGSEMMHLWFTRDLRSSFAIHAPEPELCVAHLLPASQCEHLGHAGHGG
jgi:hypothetical protein